MSVGIQKNGKQEIAAETRRGLSDSSTVTRPTELALPASEKNASEEGTMAHEVEMLKGNIIDCKNEKQTVSAEAYKDTVVPVITPEEDGWLDITISISEDCKYFYLNGTPDIRQAAQGQRCIRGISKVHKGQTYSLVIQTNENVSVGVGWTYKLTRILI